MNDESMKDAREQVRDAGAGVETSPENDGVEGKRREETESGNPVQGRSATGENGTGEGSDSDRGEYAAPGTEDTHQQDGNNTDSTTESEMGGVTYTPRFAGFTLLLITLTATAFVTFNPALIASSLVFLVFMIAGAIQQPHDPRDALDVTHTVTPTNARPGQQVTVTVTVTNTSDTTLPDIRIIDIVPDELTVTDSTPRAAKPLRPGNSLSITYEVTAKRGTYTFDTIHARNRSLIGSQWIQCRITSDEDETLRCAVTPDDIPLEEQAAHYIGGVLGNTGGEGVEFYSTREYHRGDTPSRINWRELAKRGELSTVTFREHQAADVTLIADVRDVSRVTGHASAPSAGILTMYAAYQLTSSLINNGHYTGLVFPGIRPETKRIDISNGFPYARIQHGRSTEQQERAFEYLQHIDTLLSDVTYDGRDITPIRDLGTGDFTGDTLNNMLFDVSPYKVRVSDFAHSLTGWVNGNTQFIFVTPLLDNAAQQLCLQLHSLDFPVVIVSPDITCPPTVTHDGRTRLEALDTRSLRLTRVQRATRIESLRKHGITVIDWNANEPLSVSCIRQTAPGEL